MKKLILLNFVLFSSLFANAQGHLSGDFMSNANFYEYDKNIIEPNNSLYEHYKSGAEAWLGLRYNQNGFSGFLRMDAFQNSNLKYLTRPMTSYGIGAFSLSKDIGDLHVTIGSIYDQIGSGILFRSYEDRGLLIDNALVGMSINYKINDFLRFKALGGQQKDNNLVNKYYAPTFKAAVLDGEFAFDKVQITPGIAVLNRTLDQSSMDAVATTINGQPLADRFIPKFNMYAFTGYNSLNYENLTWYVEGAFKSAEAINVNGKLENHSGSTIYSTLGWAKKGIAANLSVKRTENFAMRTAPTLTLLDGMVNWQPVVAVIRPQRLIARYSPASQDLSEMAYKADVMLAPNEDLNINLNFVSMNSLSGIKLYREIFADVEYRGLDKWTLGAGIQYLEYNLQVYRNELLPFMKAITPYVDVTYKFDDKRALRVEVEYQNKKVDMGSMMFALAEFSIAPHWSFAVSDMFVFNPDKTKYETNHYPTVFAAYTMGANRFSLAYVKQIAGINCTGGVCRYEPAFSGIKATVTSTF